MLGPRRRYLIGSNDQPIGADPLSPNACGCLLWVKLRSPDVQPGGRLCPQQRTSLVKPARSEKCQYRKWRAYSITSSARRRKEDGMTTPSALADLRLMTSSNFVGCCTGKSAGFAPFRSLAT